MFRLTDEDLVSETLEYIQRLNQKMNIMSVIKQTKVLRLKMDLPLTLWRELDFAMQLNPEWAKRILRLTDWRPADVIHDIKGILQGCEFFSPRL